MVCMFSRRESSFNFPFFWTNLEPGVCSFTWYAVSMRAGKQRIIKMLFSLLLSINLWLTLRNYYIFLENECFYLCQSPLQQKSQSWDAGTLNQKHKARNRVVHCLRGLSLPWLRLFWEHKLLEQWIYERTALFSCEKFCFCWLLCFFWVNYQTHYKAFRKDKW